MGGWLAGWVAGCGVHVAWPRRRIALKMGCCVGRERAQEPPARRGEGVIWVWETWVRWRDLAVRLLFYSHILGIRSEPANLSRPAEAWFWTFWHGFRDGAMDPSEEL